MDVRLYHTQAAHQENPGADLTCIWRRGWTGPAGSAQCSGGRVHLSLWICCIGTRMLCSLVQTFPVNTMNISREHNKHTKNFCGLFQWSKIISF